MNEMNIRNIERMLELSNVLGELKAENKQLKERVAYLEQQNLELIRFRPQPTVSPKPSFTGCSVCNMNFTGPMGYVCTRSDCPSRITC